MKKYRGLLCFVITFILIMASAATCIAGPIKYFSYAYFPLKQITPRMFDSNLGETKYSMIQDGGIFKIVYDAPRITYSQQMIAKNNGVYIVGTQNKIFLFGKKITYKAPLLRIPFPLTEASKWTSETIEYDDDGNSNTVRLTGKVIGEETISTPAGNFASLKIELIIVSGQNKPTYLTEWLVKDIGVVKAEAVPGTGGLLGTFQKLFGLDKVYYTMKSY